LTLTVAGVATIVAPAMTLIGTGAVVVTNPRLSVARAAMA
jgi:hypothetical protein